MFSKVVPFTEVIIPYLYYVHYFKDDFFLNYFESLEKDYIGKSGGHSIFVMKEVLVVLENERILRTYQRGSLIIVHFSRDPFPVVYK